MLIALTGKKRVGKSTAAEILERIHGFQRLNFKDALVAEIKQCYPDLLNEIANIENCSVDDLFVIKNPLTRTLLQNHGTNLRRTEKENYWTDKWSIAYSKMYTPGSPNNVVVDDCRFLNEAKVIKDYGGIIVRLTRSDIKNTDTHISETEMDLIEPDYTIECEAGEIECLEDELNAIVQGVFPSLTISKYDSSGSIK